MRYSKTSLMELSHRYGKILRKCAFLNAAVLLAATFVATGAKAEATVVDHDLTTPVDIASSEEYVFTGGKTAEGLTQSYGGAIENAGTLTINSYNFINNSATKGYGGAVDVYKHGTLTITGDTIFIGNSSTEIGGAIALTGRADITRATFQENVAQLTGGAISTTTDSKTVLTVVGSTFENNHSLKDGGAIGNYASLSVSNSTFTGNTAGYGKDSNDNYTVPLSYETYMGGGAIALGALSNSSVGTITDTTFNGNKSATNGGAVATRLAKDANNSAAKLDIEATFIDNDALESGGAIYNTFYTNNGLGKGDGVTVKGIFTGNKAGVNGGAIFNDGTVDKAGNPGGIMTITASEFTGNTATLSAGAIYNSGSLSVKDSEFDGNVSKTGWGGAIYSGSTGNMTIEGSTFKNNIAYNAGAIGAGTKTTGTIIKNSTFENNSAEAYGAVALFKNGELENVVFKGNKATGTKTLSEDGKAVNHGAGALFLGAESVVKITKGSFDGNTSGTRGGAIATRMPDVANNQAAKLDIDGTVFSNNIAKTEGGAIYSSFYNSQEVVNNVLIKNATFTNNQANEGGAIYNEGLADVGGNKASMYIENSTFEGNIATTNGGALFISKGGNLTLAGKNTFSGNKAAGVLNDIHNLGSLNISGDLTLDGGISGNGTIAFTGATTLTAQLKSSASILGTVEGLKNVTVAGLIVENGLTDATYNLFENGDAAFAGITATNALYTFEQGGNGQIKVTKKSTEQITENLVSSGATEQEAITISAIADSKSDNPVISSISAAVQTGNTAEAVKAVQELAPTTSQQVMGVAQSVNSLLSNVTGTRMAALGRAGGDTFVGGSVWAQGLYNHTKQDATAAAAGFSADTAGVAFGVDGKVNEDITVGVGYGYNQTDADSAGRDIDVEGHNFFAYAQYQPDAWYINGMFSYGFSKYTEDKAPMGVAMTAKYDVNTYAANVMSGYQFDDGITTEAGLRYVLADQKAYSDGAQYISTDTNDVLTAVVGVKYSTDYKAKDWTIKPSVRLAATYDILSDDSQANVSIIGGGNYQITGDRLHRFGVETGVGVTGTIKDWDLTLEYNGGFRQDYQSHTGMLKAKYNF